jgi:hypothetical protein
MAVCEAVAHNLLQQGVKQQNCSAGGLAEWGWALDCAACTGCFFSGWQVGMQVLGCHHLLSLPN